PCLCVLISVFLFPFVRFVSCRNRFGIFTDAVSGCPKELSYGGFPGQLRFAEGRICRECTSNRRIQRGQPTFASVKPRAATAGDEADKAAKERIEKEGPQAGYKGQKSLQEDGLSDKMQSR
uniref:hypothetical protein n=1 Tax=Alistipes putredinis TaxID=28117 RepID=UPI003FD82BE6